MVSDVAYTLKLPRQYSRVHPTFHVSLLRPHTDDPIAERPQYEQPEPELNDEGEEVYEVDEIINSHL